MPAWAYLSEISPAHPRGAFVGLFQAFAAIAAHSKSASIAFFAGMMPLQFIARFFFLPQTR